jgi:DNA gyrase/topoisomerase IV subunit B
MINPPLYLLLHKKLRIFARDAHALMDQRVDMYNSLLRIKVYGEVAHHELSGAAFRDFCYLIYEVGRIINAVATKLIIDPHILESLVSVVDHLDPINPEKIKEGLALDHCEYRKESDSLILTVGNVDTVIQCKDLATEIRMNVLPTLRAVKHNRIYVTVTTRHSPLYNERMMTYLQLYQVFQTINEYFVPSRLKGLAQVPPAQLVHVCLDPLTRSYTKITNVGDVDIIHEIFGVATKLRKMLIQENLQDLEQVLKFKGAKDDDYIDAE